MLVELKKTANEHGNTLSLVIEGTDKAIFSTLDDCFGVWRVENFMERAGRMTLISAYDGCSLKVMPRKGQSSHTGS